VGSGKPDLLDEHEREDGYDPICSNHSVKVVMPDPIAFLSV